MQDSKKNTTFAADLWILTNKNTIFYINLKSENMKRIFISFLAVIAMVGMANAQRVWAYNLDLEESVGGLSMCKFTFVATANATTANLVFFNADGVEVGKVAVENVVKGENVVELNLDAIPGQGALNWAVELAAEPIVEITELTAPITL